MADGVHFTGFEQMAQRIAVYRQKIGWAIRQVAKYWAAVFEEYQPP